MNRTIRRRSMPKPTFVLAALVAIMSLVGAGCTDDSGTRWDTDGSPSVTATSGDITGDDSETATDDGADEESPIVIASTTWIGALATAAGASDVKVIAPADLQHQSDYDPKPSDLALLADADFVLLGGFEGFADRLREASGSDAEVVEVEAANVPATIHAEVRKLAELFGTTEAAEAWIADFDERTELLRDEISEALPTPAPTVIVHVFMQPWVEFAGVETVGMFGPEPVSAAQLAEFTSEAPDLIFDNAHVPSGTTLDDLGATKVSLINFPSASLDLIEVFENNTRSILAAFEELSS